MKTLRILALVLLTGASSYSWACYTCTSNYTWKSHSCDTSTGDCTVTFDFKDPSNIGSGDPLSYAITGTDSEGSELTYHLNVYGFAINSTSGAITDNAQVIGVDGASYGIGVTSPGEAGTSDAYKIDSYGGYRDAVLLDFENCIVSIDEIQLDIFGDRDFELWAYTGDSILTADGLVNTNPDYNGWATADEFDLVLSHVASGTSSTELVNVTTDTKSQYWILVAGGGSNKYDDKFKLSKLVINCAPPQDCNGTVPGPGPVPVPGTLLLLGAGAVGLRRWAKAPA
jgi:hypothetical protein